MMLQILINITFKLLGIKITENIFSEEAFLKLTREIKALWPLGLRENPLCLQVLTETLRIKGIFVLNILLYSM